MKTFKDLIFEDHPISVGADNLPISIRDDYKNAKHATITFDNGYGVSVIFGKCFYSNGVDTYEVAVTKEGRLCYDTNITSDVIGYASEKKVTEIMKKVQNL